jgi:hypothetical protein
MRICFFLLALFLLGITNACQNEPGKKTSTNSKPSGGADNRPALCLDIKDELKTRCIDGAAKEGDCVVNRYDLATCIKKGSEQEWLKNKTCEQIPIKACQGTIVGENDSKQICRANNNRCENAPPYSLYVAKCKARDDLEVKNSIKQMCASVPFKQCFGKFVEFKATWTRSEPTSVRAELCKQDRDNEKCVPVFNNAQDLVERYCSYYIDVKQSELTEFFANKAGTGLITGLRIDSCQNKAGVLAEAPYVTTMGAPIWAHLINICDADLTTK